MDRCVFRQHFVEAARVARDFARKFIEEPLPDAMRFRVHLNSSYDRRATSEFKRFPEDSAEARVLETKGIDLDGVIDVLWRDGYVPQWVDLGVVGEENGEATVLDVVACGRFIDDEQRLYYANTGIAPFSPKGPTLPIGYVKGTRFSIYDRCSCWSIDDLERARKNSEKVWSLELHGPAFDDATLVAGPAFPGLEILQLYGVPLTGPGLEGLEKLPRLRHFRARLGAVEELSFSGLPVIATLQGLTLRLLPPLISSVARLVEAAPNLEDLALGSKVQTRADDTLAFQALEHLALEFPKPPPWAAMPKSLRRLSLVAPQATDEEVKSALSACPGTLASLGLRGTPVSDVILEELERFPALEYLDAVDTRVTPEALDRFAAQRTGFKCWPRLESNPIPTLSLERGTGSILDAEVQALVNPVNCAGVMGKGLALAFKKAFPEVFREYKRACDAGGVTLGRVHVAETQAKRGPKYVINFPTKQHWRDKSRLEDIEAGLVDLSAQMRIRKIVSVAIPALGCGLGGLDWKDVRRLIPVTLATHLRVKDTIRIVLFEPR